MTPMESLALLIADLNAQVRALVTGTQNVFIGHDSGATGSGTKGIILKSPDGVRRRVTVTNAGALVVTAL